MPAQSETAVLKNQSFKNPSLAPVRPDDLDVAVEGPRRALEDLQGQGGHHVGLPGHDPSPLGGLGPDGGDELGAVDEGEALLDGQRDRGEVVALEDVLGLAPPRRRRPHLPLAHEAEGEVGEGGEVAAGPDGALLGHPGEAGGVEGVDELLQGGQGDARVALGQHVDPALQSEPNLEKFSTPVIITN